MLRVALTEIMIPKSLSVSEMNFPPKFLHCLIPVALFHVLIISLFRYSNRNSPVIEAPARSVAEVDSHAVEIPAKGRTASIPDATLFPDVESEKFVAPVIEAVYEPKQPTPVRYRETSRDGYLSAVYKGPQVETTPSTSQVVDRVISTRTFLTKGSDSRQQRRVFRPISQ